MIFQLRAYKSELDIEEIVKHRTEEIFSVIPQKTFYALFLDKHDLTMMMFCYEFRLLKSQQKFF